MPMPNPMPVDKGRGDRVVVGKGDSSAVRHAVGVVVRRRLVVARRDERLGVRNPRRVHWHRRVRVRKRHRPHHGHGHGVLSVGVRVGMRRHNVWCVRRRARGGHVRVARVAHAVVVQLGHLRCVGGGEELVRARLCISCRGQPLR